MERGKVYQEDWNQAVLAPSFALAPHYATQAFRYGDSLSIYIPMFAPAEPGQGNFTGTQFAFARGDTTLSVNGEEVAASGLPGWIGVVGLPPEKTRYSVRSTATRADIQPYSDLSTHTEATWSFTSEQVEMESLPLMYFRINGPLDDLNRARPGQFWLSLTVERQPWSPPTTATVRAVTLEYSTDDGTTWTKATVAGSGANWRALVNNPASGFVSLRASVADSAGDSHSITVVRPYPIR